MFRHQNARQNHNMNIVNKPLKMWKSSYIWDGQ
jgi:hypothetical protein